MYRADVDKRKQPRVRKRLRVLFSDGRTDRTANTTNLSRTGISVSCPFVLVPGSEVHGKLLLPTVALPFRAEVMWARKARGARALEEQNSMGFRFLGGLGPKYDEFLAPELRTAAESFTMPRTAQAQATEDAQAFDPSLRDLSGEPASAPTPPSRPPPARGTTPPAAEPPGPPALPPGLVTFTAPIGRPAPAAPPKAAPKVEDAVTEATIIGDDLALPAELGPSCLALRCARTLVEEALIVATGTTTPPDTLSVALGLDVAVDPAPVAVGTRLRVAARLLDRDASTQTFVVAITAGSRTVASARYVRRLVPKPRK